MEKQIPYKIYLEESELPKAWLNLRAFMKNKPAPLLDPNTKAPITLDALSKVFCTELARQELDDTTKYTASFISMRQTLTNNTAISRTQKTKVITFF